MGPKVSVIIPVFNSREFVGKTLESVASQNFEDYEVLVVEDEESLETSEEIVNNFDDRFKYTVGGNNIPESRNIGIERAKGKFVAFLDSDDFWHPENLSKKVSYLENTPSKSFVSSKFQILKLSGDVDIFEPFEGDYVKYFMEGRWVQTSSVLVRKEVLEEVGGFDESFEYWEDFELYLRWDEDEIGFIDKILSIYRERIGSVTWGSEREQLKYFIKLCLKHWERLSEYPESLHSFLLMLFNRYNLLNDTTT